jgi:endonuclease-8
VSSADSLQQQAVELGARIVGRPVTALYAGGVTHPALVGEVITSVQVHGKHLLIGVGDALRVHVNLGTHGRLRVLPRAGLSLAAAARGSLVIVTEDVAAVWNNAHAVEMLRTESLHEHPLLSGLGPDVLDTAFDTQKVVARARARAPDTTVGELMLDQRVVAGISNAGRNEALFLERLDPWTPLGRLADDALGAVYGRTRALMQADVPTGPPGAAARRDWARPDRARPHVYRRLGRPCRVCGTPIAAQPQGAPPRSTYFCPRCQGHAQTSDRGRRR